jgi:hypothetical protein
MATNTYVPIATTTLGSATASVTYSSLGSYTDLVLVMAVQPTNNGENINLQFNSDTGTNYSDTQLTGTGTTATSSRRTTYNYLRTTDNLPNSTSFSTVIVNIMNYSNSTTNKTVLSRGGNAATWVTTNVGLWRNTAAITSIKVFASDGTSNMNSGSTFSLYGILAA